MSTLVSAVLRQISATTSEAIARQHTCRVDRPTTKGGTDLGPMGGELLLMGIGGCFMSNLLAGVATAGLDINDLTVTVTARLDGTPPRFDDVRLLVRSVHPDRAALARLVAEAETACIAIATVKAGISVTATVD